MKYFWRILLLIPLTPIVVCGLFKAVILDTPDVLNNVHKWPFIKQLMKLGKNIPYNK